jgi:hypothetical protein
MSFTKNKEVMEQLWSIASTLSKIEVSDLHNFKNNLKHYIKTNGDIKSKHVSLLMLSNSITELHATVREIEFDLMAHSETKAEPEKKKRRHELL